MTDRLIHQGKVNGMIDISEKTVVDRSATATGTIHLNQTSLDAIRNNTNPKGNVLENAKLAAVHAVKETPKLVFLAHPIIINSVKVKFEILKASIQVWVSVKAKDRTGVEIEALAGVMNALLAIFDLSKRFEKDENGQYQTARIKEIFVVEKQKGK